MIRLTLGARIATFALLIVLASAALAQSANMLFDQGKMIELANKNNKIQHDLKLQNIEEITKLLADGKFSELDKFYDGLYKRYAEDVNYESQLMAAYQLFGSGGDLNLDTLNLWVMKTGSYVAHAARGYYKQDIGFNTRGFKYLSETPQYKIKDMQRWFNEATDDLLVALKANPKLIPAYVNLINITKAGEMPFTKEEILARAEESDPRSFYVRYHYMAALVPEWGGSYEEMSAFGQRAASYSSLNPRLWVLQGSAYADIAKKQSRNSSYAAAVEYYTKALAYGDMYNWLFERAKCYIRLGNKDKAKEDYKRILYYEPEDKTALAFFGPVEAIDIQYTVTDETIYNKGPINQKSSSCAVLFVDHRTEWLKREKRKNNYKINRNLAKLESVARGLGYKVVDRTHALAALDGKLMTIEDFTEDEIKKHGKKTNADVLIVSTISSVGKNQYSGVYFQNMVILARSATDGRMLWESNLKGSAIDSAFNNYDYMTILDGIEDKLYERLQEKLLSIRNNPGNI